MTLALVLAALLSLAAAPTVGFPVPLTCPDRWRESQAGLCEDNPLDVDVVPDGASSFISDDTGDMTSFIQAFHGLKTPRQGINELPTRPALAAQTLVANAPGASDGLRLDDTALPARPELAAHTLVANAARASDGAPPKTVESDDTVLLQNTANGARSSNGVSPKKVESAETVLLPNLEVTILTPILAAASASFIDHNVKKESAGTNARKAPTHCYPGGVETEETVDQGGDAADFPVDAVYTWVKQPSQEGFEKIMADCHGSLKGGWQRMRNLGTLRFSLRMLEKHLPWVRNVIVVTDGEVPTWIQTSHPRMRFANHRDIWEPSLAERELPVHNSQPIEAYLHRIPGLSKQFLYFNDDMFIGRPLSKDFFFTSSGKPLVHATDHHHDNSAWCSHTTPGSMIGNHGVYALDVSMIQEMQDRWPDEFRKISGARCRGEISVGDGPPFLYQWYGLVSGQAEVGQVANYGWLFDGNVARADEWYEDQLSNPSDVVCINDDFATDDGPVFDHQMKSLAAFLHKFSGDSPSEFEKADSPPAEASVVMLQVDDFRLAVLDE